MASITERVRGLIPRIRERRSRSAGGRAERAQRHAEANARRVDGKRKGTMGGGQGKSKGGGGRQHPESPWGQLAKGFKTRRKYKGSNAFIVQRCNDKKKLLAERIIERFAPFRERRAGLTREYVDRVLDAGAERAQDVAGRTMVEVRQAVGLPPYRDR